MTPTDPAEAAHDAAIAAAIEYARVEGAAAGKAAASWVFDGNTNAETYRRMLTGLDEGDPEILDALPAPDLSGQWADTLTGPALVAEAIDHAGLEMPRPGYELSPSEEETASDICDAYEFAFTEAVEAEVQRVALAYLQDEEPEQPLDGQGWEFGKGFEAP